MVSKADPKAVKEDRVKGPEGMNLPILRLRRSVCGKAVLFRGALLPCGLRRPSAAEPRV